MAASTDASSTCMHVCLRACTQCVYTFKHSQVCVRFSTNLDEATGAIGVSTHTRALQRRKRKESCKGGALRDRREKKTAELLFPRLRGGCAMRACALVCTCPPQAFALVRECLRKSSHMCAHVSVQVFAHAHACFHNCLRNLRTFSRSAIVPVRKCARASMHMRACACVATDLDQVLRALGIDHTQWRQPIGCQRTGLIEQHVRDAACDGRTINLGCRRGRRVSGPSMSLHMSTHISMHTCPHTCP